MRLVPVILAAGCVAALSACTTAREAPDPFMLTIDSGRLGMMMDQSKGLAGEATTSEETDAASRSKIADDLRLAVFDLAKVKMNACPSRKLSAEFCKDDFAPAWALRRDAVPPSWATLRGRIEDSQAAISPVWSELCDAGRKQAPDKDPLEICWME